ncbi:hypothetical protein [Nafulsella turpanensis]|uniref:hypothetical protein n=1 Tax=Nafulsella turpanensis TaxID=1265690 RepID=UPI00034C8383|nr:hypothetical protein [Nafulsella turpanensis]
MFVTAVDLDVKVENVNPSISIMNSRIKKSEIEYPDPNSYFVLSEAGKNYAIKENVAYFLNNQKGYFQPQFELSPNSASVINFAKGLFQNARPIDGLAKEALVRAINKSGKAKPTLKNRL